jgi:putative MATE family efflux protein
MTAGPRSISAAPGPEPGSFWRTVRQALAGAEGQDFTQGPIGRSLLLLAVPMVLEVALESVFAVVNIFWVNRLTPAAVATVGVTEAMFSFIYALGMGLGIGATALVSRRIGEKKPEQAAAAAVQAILLGIIVSIPIAIVGGFYGPDLLRAMDAPADVVASGGTFTRIMFAGNGVVLLLFLINAIFRGAGDAAVAMRCLWIANVANLILDPLLIFGIGPFPELGVTGAAVATTVGRGLGVVYQFYRLAGRDRRFVIERQQVRVDPALMGRLFRLSASGIVQISIGTVSWAVLVRVVSHFGEAAIAGYTSAVRVIMFAILPAWGLSNAAATMVGQALGAGLPDRAETAVWRAGFFNLLFLGVLGALFVVFAPQVLFFVRDPEVKAYAVDALRIVAFGYPFYAYGMVLSNAFNGAGDTVTPTILNLCCFWALEIPLAYGLARVVGWGPRGVFVSIMVAFSVLAVASAVLFRRGRWKSQAL